MSIPFLLDEAAHRKGFNRWLEVDYSVSPHALWCGRTGSGKTVAAKILLARSVLLAPPQLQPVEIAVIDPKGDKDFNFLEDLPRFYRGRAAPNGLENIFEDFLRRQSGEDTSRNLKIAFVDEFASLVNLIEDKKAKEAAQRKLSLLLMLSRSFGFSIQTATQQPSAQTLGNSGNREQYGQVVLLGDSGNETQQMLFDADSREAIKSFGSIGGRGVGWCSINGGIAQPARVPKVQDFNKLDAAIKRGVENSNKTEEL
jgi:DNA helicase HerA-like ATPase